MQDSTAPSHLQSKFSVDGSLLLWDPTEPDAWLWAAAPVALVDSTDAREG